MTGPGAFWYNGAAAQVLAVTGFSGTVAITVPQPSMAASGTVTNPPISGTLSVTVPHPSFAASGTVFVDITGTVAITVPTPSFAASGTQFLNITGTVAITVPAPSFSATGSISGVAPPAGGGGRSRRHVVHRYPDRRPARFDPADLRVSDLHEGTVAISVPMPRFRARGYVTSPAEKEADDRLVLQLAVDDPDFNFALSDPWMN